MLTVEWLHLQLCCPSTECSSETNAYNINKVCYSSLSLALRFRNTGKVCLVRAAYSQLTCSSLVHFFQGILFNNALDGFDTDILSQVGLTNKQENI